MSNLKIRNWDFPSHLIFKTLHFHCWGHEFNPWMGNQDTVRHVVGPKQKSLCPLQDIWGSDCRLLGMQTEDGGFTICRVTGCLGGGRACNNSGTDYCEGFHDGSAGEESACNAGEPGLIPGSGRSTGERIGYPLQYSWASLMAQLVKNPPVMRETWVQSLGWEDPLEKGKATHSSILAWRILWSV